MAVDERPIPLPKLTERRRRAARRAERLRLNNWETLLFLPALCRDVGVRAPQWAVHLLEHASAVSHELPIGVIDSLTAPGAFAVAMCTSATARRWGIGMGLWRPVEHPPEARRWLIESASSTIESLAASMVLSSFGHLVRRLWTDRNPPEGKCRRGDLLEPFRPCVTGEEPEIEEDGTPGVVVFKFETETGGPAWLHRGGRGERLFRGRWVDVEVAETYARRYEHRFRSDG